MMRDQFFVINVSDMDQSKWDEWGRNPSEQRYSVDGTKLLVDFSPPKPLVFRGKRDVYGYEEVQVLLQTPEWKNVDPLRPEAAPVTMDDFNDCLISGKKLKEYM